jgi:hypothetical protein
MLLGGIGFYLYWPKPALEGCSINVGYPENA